MLLLPPDRYPLTPGAELADRTERLQAALAAAGLDAALIVQRTDLAFFAGTTQQAHLIVPASGAPLLLVRKSFERAAAETALADVEPLPGLRELPDRVRSLLGGPPARLGLELDVLPAAQYLRYVELFPSVRFADVAPLVRRVRAVKSPYEIDLIRTSAALGDRILAQTPALLRPGMTELELAAELEAFARRNGHEGLVRFRAFNQELFYGQVAAGPAAAVPSFGETPLAGLGPNPCIAQSASHRPIGRDEAVIVDYVAVRNGYLSDQTRLFWIGSLPPVPARAQQVACEIEAAVREMARPGVEWSAVYRTALAIAERAGLAEHFMGFGPNRVGFVGHGVGLEIDELPILGRGRDEPLAAGMVVAVEPKFVFPGLGAAGVENTYVVTETGLDSLNRYPLGGDQPASPGGSR
ncbi:MAG: aminopeptidase P family protein [Chloroflexi bacterium]|nr:aminopeptidase P family protein [Chloroflexota bacterium]